jgi:hypothetical protein
MMVDQNSQSQTTADCTLSIQFPNLEIANKSASLMREMMDNMKITHQVATAIIFYLAAKQWEMIRSADKPTAEKM